MHDATSKSPWLNRSRVVLLMIGRKRTLLEMVSMGTPTHPTMRKRQYFLPPANPLPGKGLFRESPLVCLELDLTNTFPDYKKEERQLKNEFLANYWFQTRERISLDKGKTNTWSVPGQKEASSCQRYEIAGNSFRVLSIPITIINPAHSRIFAPSQTCTNYGLIYSFYALCSYADRPVGYAH